MLDSLFKFNLGDKVALKTSIEAFGWSGARLLTVCVRLIHECEAGAQMCYFCRVASAGESVWSHSSCQQFAAECQGGLVNIKEPELIPWDQDEFDKANRRDRKAV